jgi:hypothetical protein
VNSSPKLWSAVFAITLVAVLCCPASANIFTNSQTINVGSGPRGIAIDDVNGDGFPDIVVANSNDNTVSVLINDGTGLNFTRHDYAAGNGPTSVAIASITNPARKDIVVCDYLGGQVRVLRNNGAGAFTTSVSLAVGMSPQSVAVGQLDNTTQNYIVVTVLSTNVVKILKWNGTALALVSPTAGYPVGRLPWAVQVGKLNGDAYPDIVTANTYGGNLSVLLSTGPHTYASAVNYPFGGGGATSVAIADLDGDGNNDLLTPNYFAAQLLDFKGNGTGVFTLQPKINDFAPLGISIAAANLQGLYTVPDVIIADYTTATAGLEVLLNDGSGNLTTRDPGSPYATGGEPVFVTTGALVPGGKLAAVASALEDNVITIWYQ